MENLKDNAEELDLIMSNFDHSIDDGLEEALRARPNEVFGRHAGWEFNAVVWFDGTCFRSEVSRYHVVVDRFKANSLRELMRLHNDKWGYD